MTLYIPFLKKSFLGLTEKTIYIVNGTKKEFSINSKINSFNLDFFFEEKTDVVKQNLKALKNWIWNYDEQTNKLEPFHLKKDLEPETKKALKKYPELASFIGNKKEKNHVSISNISLFLELADEAKIPVYHYFEKMETNFKDENFVPYHIFEEKAFFIIHTEDYQELLSPKITIENIGEIKIPATFIPVLINEKDNFYITTDIMEKYKKEIIDLTKTKPIS